MNSFFLSKTKIFSGLQEDEINTVLTCLDASERKFMRKEIIFQAGTVIKEIGLLTQGNINVVEYDYWGNTSILGNIKEGDIFGLSYAAIPGKQLQSNTIANEDCTVLFLNIEKLLKACSRSCPYHTMLIQNLFRISATKTYNIRQRMKHTSPKTIRGKLISYLSEQAFEHGSPDFVITFNRQQLAEYLGVDRSALSNELSKMRKDGLIVFEKNRFRLYGKIYEQS